MQDIFPETAERTTGRSARKNATRKRGSNTATEPPDDLDSDQREQLLAWVRKKEPWAEPKVDDFIEATLDWHRAQGDPKKRLKADWVAACRTRIRNDREWAERDGRPHPSRSWGQQPEEAQRKRPLIEWLEMLADLPGEDAEKTMWLQREVLQVKADSERSWRERGAVPGALEATVRSTLVRYYRRYLETDRWAREELRVERELERIEEAEKLAAEKRASAPPADDPVNPELWMELE